MSRRASRRGRAVTPARTSLDFEQSTLRLAGIGLVCAKLALIPVVFDQASDVPFSVIKALLSHALAYVLAGVMLALIVRHGRLVLRWSWLHVPVLAFLAANVAATLFALDALLALYGAHTRMGGLGTIADGALLYFAIALLVRTGRDALALAVSLFAGSVVVLAYEFVQIAGKDPWDWAIDSAVRPFSTIGQATSLALYLSVVAVGTAALAIFHIGLPMRARVLLIGYAVLAVTGTVITQTRSAILGIIAGGALLLALTWAAHPHPRARLISVVAAAAGAAALAVVLMATPLGTRILGTVETSVVAEGDSGLDLEDSAETRVALYRISLEMLRARPVLGYGPDNFLASLPRHRSDSEPFEVQDNPSTSAHSWVAQTAVTSGAVGLGSFIAIAVVALVLTFRRGFRPEAWAALAMLGAFLGAALTTVNAVATDWLFWAAAGAVAASTYQPIVASARPAPQWAPARTRSAIAYSCVGVGLVLALTTILAIDASRSANASHIARLRGQIQAAIDLGLRATRADSQRPQYWSTLGLAYVSADRLGEAASAFDRASRLAPYDVRYDGDLARAFAALFLKGDTASAARARDVADRAVRTDPNNPRAHQTRAVVMQLTGNLPEALKSSERALALDRTSSAGHTTNRAFYVTGVQILNAFGRPLDAIAVGRRGIARLPDDVTRLPVRIELSRALLGAGRAAEAQTEIELVLALRPNDRDAQQVRAQIRSVLGN